MKIYFSRCEKYHNQQAKVVASVSLNFSIMENLGVIRIVMAEIPAIVCL